jgi:hypothetical protein
MVTTTQQLQYYMRFKPNFLEVFCNNHISDTHLLNYSFIVNTDTCNLNGTHWVAIKVFGLYLIYFDPMGWIPFRSILKQFSRKTIYVNYSLVQNGSTCGEHCVYYLYNNQKASNDIDAIAFINNRLK